MDTPTLNRVLARLRKTGVSWPDPYIDVQTSRKRDPFRVLVACILSLRTKDDVTAAAAERLFSVADTPDALRRLDTATISRLIYPVGFYRRKAGDLRKIGALIADDYGGTVPDTIDELLRLPGVGRKTANLVVSVGYDKPAICVDTHVHRIMNRLGYVETKTPDQTEQVLRQQLPQGHWKSLNGLLVKFGQNICVPVSPRCSQCPVSQCERRGVERSR